MSHPLEGRMISVRRRIIGALRRFKYYMDINFRHL